MEATGRFIGALHGVKRTTKGTESPTVVAIIVDGKKPQIVKLGDEAAEHAFLLGTYVPSRAKEGTEPIGLQLGDVFATCIEGLSGQLATAAARIGETRGFRVVRIPSYWFKQERDALGASQDDDPITLGRLAKEKPERFWPVRERDSRMAELVALVRSRKDVMNDRRSAMLRVIARVRRNRYRTMDLTQIGPIEEAIEAAKASDRTVKVLEEEEKGVIKEIELLHKELPHWAEIFKPVAGIGPVGAAEIMASVQDIRRFETSAKLCAYWGVHLRSGTIRVNADGTRDVLVPGFPKFSAKVPREVQLPEGAHYRFFPKRRTSGLGANWDEWVGKQALFKFASFHWKQWHMGQKDLKVKAGWSSWTKKLDDMYQRQLSSDRWKPLLDAADAKGDAKERKYLEVRVRKLVFWRFCRSFVRYVFARWWAIERVSRGQEVEAAAA
ncbi:MAG: transposase [bacterium]|nr:transposase [bacterium]